MRAAIYCFGILSSILTLFGCTRQNETFSPAPLSDYLPIHSGKYFIYRTDSIVFTNIQRNIEVHSYLEKQTVDTTVTDNLGRTAYVVYRFLTDTSGTQPWASAGTFLIVPNGKTLEIVDDNLRYVKLVQPLAANYTWKANNYLPADPYEGMFNYNFDDNINLNSWDFSYSSVDGTDTLNGVTYNHIVRAEKSRDTFNIALPNVGFGVNVNNPNITAYMTYSRDDYAKGIGMVFQQLSMWEYQPPGTNGNSAYYTGFCIRRSMISHN